MLHRLGLLISVTALLGACGGSVASEPSASTASPPGSSTGDMRDGGSANPSSGTTSTGTTGTPTKPPLGPIGSLCGTRGAPSSCGPKLYCHFPMNKSGIGTCGREDSGGTCQMLPDACDDNYAPVCGCDGKTYSNDCDANAVGVSTAHISPCGSFRCGMEWCDAGTEYCDVPDPQTFNPVPTCLALPTSCASTGGKMPTCATCFPPTPCPMGSNCNATCTVEQADGRPGFTLTH